MKKTLQKEESEFSVGILNKYCGTTAATSLNNIDDSSLMSVLPGEEDYRSLGQQTNILSWCF